LETPSSTSRQLGGKLGREKNVERLFELGVYGSVLTDQELLEEELVRLSLDQRTAESVDLVAATDKAQRRQ